MGEFDGVLARLKGMSADGKKDVCERLRNRIIDTVSSTGGHLASNLGVVELTVGLYSVIDPFYDKVIWDVGHQCYAHKLLTGRDDSFDTLRSSGGISGFPMSSESPADCFETGHSSTSVSAAAGFARARRLSGGDWRICAVIGDGAFGSGMVFEALNDAGQLTDNITVILNDNGMSISPNVGAFHRYLIRLRSGRRYIKAKSRVKRALDKMGGFGRFVERRMERVKGYMRSAVVPEGELFTDLGWKYIGPIDGHDVSAVEDAVQKAELIGGPVIIHAITKKGHGYAPAEENPSAFHGVGPASDLAAPARGSFSECLGKTLCELGAENGKIVAVCAAMVGGTGLMPFAEAFPERYFDVGIAEEHAVTMSAAMAKTGLKPFICLYSTFSQRAYDQILHDIALPGNAAVLCLDRGGASGRDGRTHQGIYDLAFMNTMPGFILAAPCDTNELKAMARLASVSDKPFALRYPAKVPAGALTAASPCEVETGKGVIAFESKNDLPVRALFITLGVTVFEAVKAAELLESKGYGAVVFNARFLKPIDRDAVIRLLRDYPDSAVVTAEDGIKAGGFGEQVMRIAAEEGLCADRIIISGFPDVPVGHASVAEIYREFGLDGESLAKACLERIERAGECS
ncbi:MAG: 1-deoxy-D-xylulose-5-phosphate synthase [Clostridia bacterium]|nr:1-deoxy-D-xylulose-5-phosphate synthase [Clostridia bacterium]